MKAVIQRVKMAAVLVDGKPVGYIGKGLLIYLGIHKSDQAEIALKMAEKIVKLRIFPAKDGRMDHSLAAAGGSVLVVSQFTLYGDVHKGNRPNFADAAGSEMAEKIYEAFINGIRSKGLKVETGNFGAMMAVESINDGPVTVLAELNSENI